MNELRLYKKSFSSLEMQRTIGHKRYYAQKSSFRIKK